MENINLINGDCLIELKKIKDKSIDFVYLDLPFGQTACLWDIKVDLKALWIELRRIAKNDRTPFFFSCTTKFGFELYNNAPKNFFRWDLVWEKNRAAGFLNSYRLPLRKHEMVYCFAEKSPDYDVSSHLTGKTYESTKEQAEIYGKMSDSYIVKETKEPLPTSILPPQEEHELLYCFAKKTPKYDVSSHKELTNEGKKYDILYKENAYSGTGAKVQRGKVHKEPLPTSVLPPQEEHELVYCFAKKSPDYDVSSHLTGEEVEHPPSNNHKYLKEATGYHRCYEKPHKSKVVKEPLPTSVLDINGSSEIYNIKATGKRNQTKKDQPKLPTSIIEDIPSSWCKYSLDEKVNHRTAKPVKLMEFLLKYWSKEGDTILDPTAGSGSMGLACINMNRKFIGIEKDVDIFKIMKDRIENHKKI
jgi:hypothetical protein